MFSQAALVASRKCVQAILIYHTSALPAKPSFVNPVPQSKTTAGRSRGVSRPELRAGISSRPLLYVCYRTEADRCFLTCLVWFNVCQKEHSKQVLSTVAV